MGVSTNAYLIFGFPVGDEDQKPDWLDEDEEFDDYVCRNLSVNASWEERSSVINACPAQLEYHCSGDYPMYVLAVRGFGYSAWRGDLTEVTSLDVDPEKIAAFKAWCEENEIPYEEPKWFLCSYYSY